MPKKRINVDIDIPLNHAFDKKQVKKFLKACNEPFINPKTKVEEREYTAEIVKKIIDNTQHISFKKFISLLISNIKDLIKLLDKKRPLFINIGNKKNFWLHNYVIKYIQLNYPLINIIILKNNVINHKQLIDNDIVVLIDEFIFDIELSIYISKFVTNQKLRFFILSSFATKPKIKRIENSFNILKSHGNTLIFNKSIIIPKETSDILTTEEIRKISNIYQHLADANYKLLIYFDHTLGDSSDTIVCLYLGVVPNAMNKHLLIYTNKNLDKLHIINILKNCETIKKYNLNNYTCPKQISF